MARPRRHGARLPLRRPWEWGRVWVPADFYVLRRICECVAGNANPDEGPQVRAVVRILSAARVRHVGQTSDHLRDAHLLAGQAQPEFERAASHSGRCRVRTIDTSTPFTCHNVWFPALTHGLQNVHSPARRGRTTLPSSTPLESSETGPDRDVSVLGSSRMTALAAGKLLSEPGSLVSTAIRPAVNVVGAVLPNRRLRTLPSPWRGCGRGQRRRGR